MPYKQKVGGSNSSLLTNSKVRYYLAEPFYVVYQAVF